MAPMFLPQPVAITPVSVEGCNDMAWPQCMSAHNCCLWSELLVGLVPSFLKLACMFQALHC